jgi:hypothetical protein
MPLRHLDFLDRTIETSNARLDFPILRIDDEGIPAASDVQFLRNPPTRTTAVRK